MNKKSIIIGTACAVIATSGVAGSVFGIKAIKKAVAKKKATKEEAKEETKEEPVIEAEVVAEAEEPVQE